MQRLRIVFFALVLLRITTADAADAAVPFQFLGRFQWVQRNVLNHPQKLPDIQYKTPVVYTTDSQQPVRMLERKMPLYKSKSGQPFTAPQPIALNWKASAVGPVSKITAPPFSVRDNAVFNIVYMDKAHGMFSDDVSAMAEDTFHRIWMGTSDGLVQYDGHNYRVYTTQSGLLSNSINDVRFDPQSGLWIATSEGLQLLRHDSLFEPHIAGVDSRLWNVVKTNTDSHGNHWVNTINFGSICISPNLQQLRRFDTSCGLPANAIKYALLDKQNNYWFAGYGLVHVQGNTFTHWKSKKIHFNDDEWLTLLEDNDTMWAGTFDNGLLKITASDTLQLGISPSFSGRVFSVIKANHAIWFTMYGGGVGQIKGHQYQVYKRENGLSGMGAYHLLPDAYGNIWVSTLDAGWSRINRASIVPDRQIPEKWHPSAIHQDQQGRRWFFLNGAGIRRVAGNAITLITNKSLPPVPSVMHFMDGILNNDGSAWLASYSYGIAYFDQQHITFHYFSDQPTDRVVLAAVNDGRHTPWFATLHFGLIFVRNESFYHVSSRDGLLSDRTGPIATDASGALISLSAKGVQRISGDTLYDCYVNRQRLDVEAICYHQAGNGAALIGTDGQGLLMMKGDSLFRISSLLGNGAPAVSGILEDAGGKLWMTTKSGMVSARLHNNTLSEVALLDNVGRSVFGQIIPVGYVDENKVPHWSTNKGMLMYAPEVENDQEAAPGMRFLKATIKDSVADFSRPLHLYPDEPLVLEYASIHWGSDQPSDQHYLVIDLERKDTVEAIVTEDGVIKLQQKEPGNYKMLLVEKSGGTTNYSTPVYFCVHRYWYNTWWFYALCVLALVGLIVIYFTRRSWRLQQTKQALEQAVTTRTAELTAAVEERSVLLKEMHHRVKNNLQIISGLLELQKDEMTDELLKQAFTEGQSRLRSIALIHQNLYEHQDLAKVQFKVFVAELLQYMQEVFEDKNKRLEVKVQGLDAYFGTDIAVPLGLVINELLTNAYKYAADEKGLAQVVLNLKKRPDGKYELEYSDKGPGIKSSVDFTSATTLGLRLVKGLTGQFGGTVTYTYRNGAIFTLVFSETKRR